MPTKPPRFIPRWAHAVQRKAWQKAPGAPKRMAGRAWQAIREQVMFRDGMVCRYCGKVTGPSDIEIDHVVPLSKGGSNDLSNLVTACKPCNQAKRGKAAHKVKGCDAQGNPHGRDDW